MFFVVTLAKTLSIGLLTLSLVMPAYASAPTNVSLADAGSSSIERPRSPWVFRSVLDGKSRIVTAALNKDLFFAFDTDNASMYKVWNGGVELVGSVYDASHGPQPGATGFEYYGYVPEGSVWQLRRDQEVEIPQVRFRGYRFAAGSVIFKYDLITTRGQKIHVEEIPEYVTRNGQQGLERRFTLRAVPKGMEVGYQTAFTSLAKESDVVTNGRFEQARSELGTDPKAALLRLEGTLWLRSADETRVTNYYHPQIAAIAPPITSLKKVIEGEDEANRLMEASDCSICHNPHVQTVGPAYQAIAERYEYSPAIVAALADKVIKGGGGVWGTAVMTPHPNLSPDDAQQIVSYLLKLRPTEKGAPKKNTLFPKGPSVPLVLDDTNKLVSSDAKKSYPGLAVSAAHIEDLASNFISPPVLAGVTPVINVVHAADLGPITTQVHMRFRGFIRVPKAGTYDLRLVSDDGGRVIINGKKVAERWQVQSATPLDMAVPLQAGTNQLEIEYFQAQGGGAVSFQWKQPDAAHYEVVPESALSHHRALVEKVSPYIPRGKLVKNIPGDTFPLAGVHPSFDLSQARPSWFEPKVGGMDFLDNDRLVVCTWDGDGPVYILDNINAKNAETIKVTRIASGLAECLGVKVVDGEIYIVQKHELTHLVDANRDGAIEEYRTVSDQWRVSANFHEFAFGLEYEKGYFYMTLATAIMPGGASASPQVPDRGKVLKVSAKNGAVEFIAHGLRTPNGIGRGVDGQMFIADNQGDWLPASKIVHLQPGAFYGARSVDFAGTEGVKVTPPVVWLPHDEIGNSPSEPIYIDVGDYRGQMLHGEVTHGGVKRVYVEKVNGHYQGAVFRFTQGLEAGINRLVWGPDKKTLYLGGVGSRGNWGHDGKYHFGLQKLGFNGKSTFEILAVSARSNGLELRFTQPIEPNRGLLPKEFEVKQWHYLPTSAYGGPKMDVQTLNIRAVNLSEDRKRVFLELDGMKAEQVLYVHISDPFRSEQQQALWSTEAWYTMNSLPKNRPGFSANQKPPVVNTLTKAEQEAGWKLLFNGKTTEGWRNFRSDTLGRAWTIDDDSLHLKISGKEGWQSRGGGDIITTEEYENFELSLEWKVAPGGNSGIIYNVVESDKYDYVWQTGPEYQLLDNTGHPDGAIKAHRAGDLYDLIPSRFVAVNAGGQWNRTLLISRNGKVEHWLNGYKVVDFEMHTPQWSALIAQSKFADMPAYGRAQKGHIALQDHGDPVWFRNIKIRKLQ